MNSTLISFVVSIVVLVLNGFYWNHHGYEAAELKWTAKIETERSAATVIARGIEQAQQGKVNEALRKQNEEVNDVNATLRRDLDGLRKRASRRAELPDTTAITCTGSSGAELSREDAEFLTREAARADELRAGLGACYAVIDTR